jgi:hypothetical protein
MQTLFSLLQSYGRRIAIITGCLLLFVGVAIQSAAQNFSSMFYLMKTLSSLEAI